VQGTPLGGATLLHMCVDYGELEIATWLLDHGMDVNVRAAVDTDGFGGHTPLFSAVVSWDYYVRAKYASPKPLGWERFHAQDLVSRPAMRLIAMQGGRP
jgi:hypothetical protein